MRILPILLALFPALASGLETDNYLSWGKELRDSAVHINRYLLESISASLEELQDHDSRSCREVTEAVAKSFTSRLVHDNPVENWLFEVLGPEEMYPETIHHVEASIYREPFRFYIPWFGLAPNIQVNGVYFGTDKLSHFASTGMIYFRIYYRVLKRNKSHQRALEAAIDWGIKDEKTVHGYWASGVFSYSDLEANYQGLRFYRNFCESDRPYLKKQSGRWVLSSLPDIRDYVNPLWDETFEPSYRLPPNWEKVSEVIRANYCPLAESPLVKERFSSYREFRAGQSRAYLSLLQLQGRIPVPQSVTRLCSGF